MICASVVMKDTVSTAKKGGRFEGRNSRDDDLMRDRKMNGQIDGDRDRERGRPRGLEEQR